MAVPSIAAAKQDNVIHKDIKLLSPVFADVPLLDLDAPELLSDVTVVAFAVSSVHSVDAVSVVSAVVVSVVSAVVVIIISQINIDILVHVRV